ncbi:hypothetical protein ACHAQA_000558 [Verticillium albo-atrum]
MKSAILLALAAVVAAKPCPGHIQPVCNADNCLRALRNTARPGVADCSTVLRFTVTPAAVAITETDIVTATPTVTVEETQTDTVIETVEVVVTPTITFRKEKRDLEDAPATLPAYASACSGAVRYTSACECLGVFPTVTTAAAPTLTQLVEETVAPTTITETVIVATVTITHTAQPTTTEV